MKQEHLSESQLQRFALTPHEADSELTAHVHDCEKCAAAIVGYRSIFSALGAMERPAFNFDVAKQVLAQLPAPVAKKGIPWSFISVGMIAMVIFGITIFVLMSYFKNLFNGISEMVLSIIIVTALTIIAFQCREVFASYRKKMNLLKSY